MTCLLPKSEVARYLAGAARLAPSADNSQPFDFIWDGTALSICFSQKRSGTGVFGENAHAILLALGAAVECISQAADAAKLEVRWHWHSPSRGIYAHLSIEKEIETGVFPAHLPLAGRHTNRFPFSRLPLPIEVKNESLLQHEGVARVSVISSEESLKQLVRNVRIASESRFCTQELHDWLMGSLRLDAQAVSRGDGLDVTTLNLPPGGGLFMRSISDWQRMKVLNRFGLFKLLALTETQLLSQAPAIFCLIGKDGVGNTIDAGRLLTRVWIQLNSSGVAVHPYYVVTDQLIRLKNNRLPGNMIDRVQRVHDCLPAIIDAHSDEMLHMLLRVGLPKKDPPRSRRLPLEEIFFDQS